MVSHRLRRGRVEKLADFRLFFCSVLGLVIAGVLMLASWRWIFRFFAILLMPGTALGFFLIPKRAPHIRAEQDAEAQEDPKWKRMDGLGCALMLCSSTFSFSILRLVLHLLY